MKDTKVLMIGLGLIGGSLAKNIMQLEDSYVYGFDTNRQTLEFALKNGIIHETAADIRETALQVDCIVLATPISDTIKMMQQMDGFEFDHPVIMTDVCSVKGSIMRTAKQMQNPMITFIGGHPMAGSHKKGVVAANDHLFENAIYILTPLVHCTEGHVEQLKHLLRKTNSNIMTLNPDEHDEMTGVISHFPHLIASSLVHQAKKWEKTHAYIPKLAAGGFRDITRIASSNPALWQDIFYHNRGKMSRLLHDWITEMVKLKGLIDLNDKEQMVHYLEQAREYRDGLEKGEKGAIPSFYDLYVDIPDQSGAVASVVQILAAKDISIKNIEILEIRDTITGVLRLSFPSEAFRTLSFQILSKKGYELLVDE